VVYYMDQLGSLVNTVMNFWVPLNATNFLTILASEVSKRERECVSDRMSESQQSLPSRGGVASRIQTPPLVEEEAPFKNTYKSGKNKNMVMAPDGARNQERLCWRGPAAIYWTGLSGRLLAS
jgi:hypothetical protein